MQQINETESYNQSNPSAEPVIASEADAAGPAPSASPVSMPNQPKTNPFWVRLLGLRSTETGQYDTEDRNRRSTLLRNMDIATLVFLAVTVPSAYFMKLLSTGDYTASGLAVLAVIISYILLRLNQVVLASYSFIGGVLLALIIRSTDTQLNLAENLSDYFAVAVLIVLSGMLISELAPFGLATLAVAGFAVVLGQFASRSGTDANAIIQTIIFGGLLHYILATMSYFNARTINQSLRQMRWQNQELLKVNHQFEQNMQVDLTIATAVSDLSGDLSTISHDQSERAQSQAQSVAIVTSTLEELSATARQIAEVAESVFTATEQALRTAEAGGQSVGLSIDSIATLTSQVEAINDIANDLGGQSRRISEIVETITELAEETNLLALNATIEAAGAGEYGRRFAVVASEVQMLANRSRAASRDVQAILGQIRNLINNTLRATDEGLNEARRMSEIAGQAGEAIEQIIETVESTTFLARQINLTTQQQRSATDQAVDMIRQVASDAREAAARAQQLLQASDRLNDTAVSLRRD